MVMSNAAMANAAGEIRSLLVALTAAVEEIGHPTTWSGTDAERFQRDWNDLVRGRLVAAANKLDGVDFRELTGGFGG